MKNSEVLNDIEEKFVNLAIKRFKDGEDVSSNDLLRVFNYLKVLDKCEYIELKKKLKKKKSALKKEKIKAIIFKTECQDEALLAISYANKLLKDNINNYKNICMLSEKLSNNCEIYDVHDYLIYLDYCRGFNNISKRFADEIINIPNENILRVVTLETSNREDFINNKYSDLLKRIDNKLNGSVKVKKKR